MGRIPPTGTRWILCALAAFAFVIAGAVISRPAAGVSASEWMGATVVERPQGVAAGGGAAWVASLGAHAVVRLDPATGRVQAVAPLDFPPLGLVYGAGALWITGGFNTVARLDPQTNRVAARIRVGLNPRIPAATDAAVWIPNAGAGTISRIDPRTNQVVATITVADPRDCPTAPEPLAVAVAQGAVWATRCGARAVARIDPARNRVAATIPLGVEPTALAFAGGALWVASAPWDEVARIDPNTDWVTARLRLAGPRALAGGAGGIWVATAAGAIAQIDPRTLRRTDVGAGIAAPGIAPPSPGPSLPGLMPAAGAGTLAAGDASLWVSAPAANTVYRLGLRP